MSALTYRQVAEEMIDDLYDYARWLQNQDYPVHYFRVAEDLLKLTSDYKTKVNEA